MMLASGFRQMLSGICKSFAGLSLRSQAVHDVNPPPPLRPNQSNRLQVGTFNVQSLGSHRRQQDTLPRDFKRYKIDIIGLQETKISTLGRKLIGDYTLLTLPAKQEKHGIGFAVSARLRPYMWRYWAHTDRIGILQLNIPHTGRINVISAYAPHNGRPLHDVDRFYMDLHDTLDSLPRRDITIITGDFNAKLGQRHCGESFMGPHARGARNRNGHALANFCDSFKLFATNTGFQKRAKHKTTWSQRRTDICIYNQIDYALCPQSCRRFCMDAQSWGGTDTTSDHKLVTADFVLQHARRLRFRPKLQAERPLRLARDQLMRDEDTRDKYTTALQHALANSGDDTALPVLMQWKRTLDTVRETAETTVAFTTPRPRNHRYDDAILRELSSRQRALQLRIYNDRGTSTAALRKERNVILQQIKFRCRDLANMELDEKIKQIESLSDTAQFYEAVRAIRPRHKDPFLLRDSNGKYILHQGTTNNLVRSHFKTQFALPARSPVAPDCEARALDRPITADEFRQALRQLNNRRASGPDEIPAELLKYGADELAPRLATLLNRSFEQGEPLDLGAGTLLCLPKPNKPRRDCSSLRPIVLLNSIRKAVSLIALRRISPAVDSFLSPHQSGFRKNRNTADAVWTHRWLCARAQKYRERIHVLGIDLSRAFDRIDRHKLLSVLETFLTHDDIRIIRLLLSKTTMSLRAGGKTLDPFESNTGTPQGDSLSPVLFVVYLEAALRDVARELDVPHQLLEQMVVYADDADFICRDPAVVELILERAPAILARWSLEMNVTKTELTKIERHVRPAGETRHMRADEETWRLTKKLGSLLGDAEDLNRRKTLAAAALNRLWVVWLRTHATTDKTRVRLYNCFVLPVFLYNSGTWALTPSELHRLESSHRRQLRSILNIRYPRHVSNQALYEICQERPLRHRITSSRWGLFGHILRRPEIPAYSQMVAYFAPSEAGKWRGRPRTTLPLVLDADLVSSGCGHRLRNAHDLEDLRQLAMDKTRWKTLMTSITDSLPAMGNPTYADTTLCRRLAKLSLTQA